eukprot:m.188351 g.188351  ORF g.188351 m.188351 type:complete len:378 (-) comp32340_c1_seq1:84-1217(-)
MSTSPPPSIVGFGNPMIDVMLNTTTSYLKSQGVPIDGEGFAFSAEFREKMLAEMMDNPKAVHVPGGSAMNTLCAAQWVINAKFANVKPEHDIPTTHAFGSVGDDKEGTRLENHYKAAGVTAYLKRVPNVATGHCCVLVPESGLRSLLGVWGAHKFYDTAVFKSETSPESKAFSTAALFYTTSLVLTNTCRTEVAELMATTAIQNKKKFMLNLSSVSLMTKPDVADRCLALMNRASIVFGNEDEIVAFANVLRHRQRSGRVDIDSTPLSLTQALSMIKAELLPTGFVVATRGKDPVAIYKSGETDVLYFHVPKLDQQHIVDTNGAGDSFVGGFLAGQLLGCQVEECVRLGNAASRECLQHTGAVFDADLQQAHTKLFG